MTCMWELSFSNMTEFVVICMSYLYIAAFCVKLTGVGGVPL